MPCTRILASVASVSGSRWPTGSATTDTSINRDAGFSPPLRYSLTVAVNCLAPSGSVLVNGIKHWPDAKEGIRDQHEPGKQASTRDAYIGVLAASRLGSTGRALMGPFAEVFLAVFDFGIGLIWPEASRGRRCVNRDDPRCSLRRPCDRRRRSGGRWGCTHGAHRESSLRYSRGCCHRALVPAPSETTGEGSQSRRACVGSSRAPCGAPRRDR